MLQGKVNPHETEASRRIRPDRKRPATGPGITRWRCPAGVFLDVCVDVDPLARQRDDDQRRGMHRRAGRFTRDGPEPGQVLAGEYQEGLALAEPG